jgi:hypothetical protein
VPELPEVEITTRRVGAMVAGTKVESALAPGMVALKSVDTPLSALAGRRIEAVRRVGKMPLVELAGDRGDPLALLVHLMSAGRLQVFEKRASLSGRRSRLWFRRAVWWGLAFVLLWENAVAYSIEGIARFTVSEWGRSILESVPGVDVPVGVGAPPPAGGGGPAPGSGAAARRPGT